MVTIQLNWKENRDHWGTYLHTIGLPQIEIANYLKVSDVTMSTLVKKMTDGQGLTASVKDRDRWERAIAYVEMYANKVKEF